MKAFFEVCFAICLFIIFGIGLEKTRFPQLSIQDSLRKFKADFLEILKVAFEKPRHEFEPDFAENIMAVLDNMHHEAFQPQIFSLIFGNVPLIRISFVPVRDFETAELIKLCRLIALKFATYQQAHLLNWRYFVEYYLDGDTILINLWYAEQETDNKPLMERYRMSIRQKKTHGYGMLRDEALEQELKDVK